MATRLLWSFLLILLVGSQSHGAFASVEETCAKAMEGWEHKNLKSFCVTTLQAAPGSASADAHGLAVIATNLTMSNYTAAVDEIKKLERRGGWPEDRKAALSDCRRWYKIARYKIVDTAQLLAAGRKLLYVYDMGSVRYCVTRCDDALDGLDPGVAATTTRYEHEKSPLRKVNDDAENLSTMAMLIVMTLL